MSLPRALVDLSSEAIVSLSRHLADKPPLEPSQTASGQVPAASPAGHNSR